MVPHQAQEQDPIPPSLAASPFAGSGGEPGQLAESAAVTTLPHSLLVSLVLPSTTPLETSSDLAPHTLL